MRKFGEREKHLIQERMKYVDTCLAVSDELVVFGSESGYFWAYNRETCELWG